MVDFGALPPEINSARMYAGAGSAPLQAAASSWNAIAAELSSAATGYDTVVTRLASEEWLGPASTQMASAVSPYVTWMGNTAAQAEQSAVQARSAAAAYEQAFAATVPPPLIAANRATLTQALQTNVLGQNSSLIAQLESQYSEMWAQDASAMYQYAGQSAAAAKVPQLAAPAAIANPAGQAIQAAAVTQAAATPAATTTDPLTQLLQSIQTYLTNLTIPNPPTTTDPSGIFQLLFGTSTLPNSLSALVNDYAPYAGFFYNTEGLPYFSIGMANNFVQSAKTLGLLGGAAPAAAPAAGGAAAGGAAAGGLGAGLGAGLGGGLGGAPVAAGVGSGASAGGLSVPPSWSTATAPATAPANAGPLPVTSISGAPEGSGAGNLLGGMPLAGAGGMGPGGAGPRYGFRPTVMTRPPFAG